jgi:hypothetical protein
MGWCSIGCENEAHQTDEAGHKIEPCVPESRMRFLELFSPHKKLEDFGKRKREALGLLTNGETTKEPT